MLDSVTVSMGEETRGVFRVIFLVRAEVRSYWWGKCFWWDTTHLSQIKSALFVLECILNPIHHWTKHLRWPSYGPKFKFSDLGFYAEDNIYSDVNLIKGLGVRKWLIHRKMTTQETRYKLLQRIVLCYIWKCQFLHDIEMTFTLQEKGAQLKTKYIKSHTAEVECENLLNRILTARSMTN